MISSRPQRRAARGPSPVADSHRGGQTDRGGQTNRGSPNKLGRKKLAAPWIGLALVVATFVTYANCLHNGFVNFDDDRYVFAKHQVLQGISLEGTLWAFTTTDFVNWHPLTWLSLQLDAWLFGPRPTGFHATNLLLHCANTLVLFQVLCRMTAAPGRSAAAAAFFAVHPLHVESVAWVSERKDVLSGLFFLLTLWAYHAYVRAPSWRRYLPVVLLFALGLLAKPMLVTLPFVLLLIDCWPLGRLRQRWAWLVAEKGPLLALSLGSCAVTYLVQQSGGAIQTAEQLPIMARLANVPTAYVEYLAKTVWPARLAVYYPHPHEAVNVGETSLRAAILLALTAAAVYRSRRSPWLTVGWLWWLGMLIPVIGIVQVGGQAYADRYMYLPMIGLLIALVWTGHELSRQRCPSWLVGCATGTLLVACALASREQVNYWHDSLTLWQHTADVTPANPVTLNSLGVALAEKGRTREAVERFQQGLALAPDDERCHQNLALALIPLGQLDGALEHLRHVLRVNPENASAQFNAGVLVERRGEHDAAIQHFRRALAIDPNYWRAQLQLGRVLLRTGQTRLGEQHLKEALRLNPGLIKDLPIQPGES